MGRAGRGHLGVAHLLWEAPARPSSPSRPTWRPAKRLQSEISSFEGGTKSWAKPQRPDGLQRAGRLGWAGHRRVHRGARDRDLEPLRHERPGPHPGPVRRLRRGLAASGAGTKRTTTGRDLWSPAGGFRRILSTPSAQDRFDFSRPSGPLHGVHPWAVAFGCADQWAEKYRAEMVPSRRSRPGCTTTPARTPAPRSLSMVDDFHSTVSSAILLRGRRSRRPPPGAAGSPTAVVEAAGAAAPGDRDPTDPLDVLPEVGPNKGFTCSSPSS